MVMKRNEEISIRAGRAVEKLALDLLDRKSTESILVEFNTPTHAFKVSPVRVSDNDAAAAQERLAQKLRDVRFNSDWSFLPPSAFLDADTGTGKVASLPTSDPEVRQRIDDAWSVIRARLDLPLIAQRYGVRVHSGGVRRPPICYMQELCEKLSSSGDGYRKTAEWHCVRKIREQVEKILAGNGDSPEPRPMDVVVGRYKKPCPYKFDFAEMEKRVLAGISTVCIDGKEISAAAWLAMAPDELVAPPIDDDKLAAAHKVAVDSGRVANADEPPKCSEKPIYYFASNDYRRVQAWAEEQGLPDWNRAKAGFDYPPNAVVVVSFYFHGGDTYEMAAAATDAKLRGIPIEPRNRVEERLHAVSFPEFEKKFLGYIASAFGIRPELLT